MLSVASTVAKNVWSGVSSIVGSSVGSKEASRSASSVNIGLFEADSSEAIDDGLIEIDGDSVSIAVGLNVGSFDLEGAKEVVGNSVGGSEEGNVGSKVGI